MEETYLTSARYRRTALEESLVNPANDYSRLRLAHYARDWDALPEWNPGALTIGDDAKRGDPRALLELGKVAFYNYPVQRMPPVRVALGSRQREDEYGLWSDGAHRPGAIVSVAGDSEPWLSCATCHAREHDGHVIVGAGNDRLELGRMYVESKVLDSDATRRANTKAWGAGRMDVTTLSGDEVARIPDLRVIQFQSHLHQDATLRMRDVTALAIRIETLIIVSSSQTRRPPREVTLGLARYLWSLGDDLKPKTVLAESEQRGLAIFTSQCSSCHAPPTFSGEPVPLSVIGTDPTLGRSHDRGTGNYRVPSLRGVSTRGRLLHDGSIDDLDALFDPSRTNTVKGHLYGLELGEPARADLIGYLRTL